MPQVMALKGWLKDPADIEYRSFTDVHKTFVNKAASAAQDGNDYDIPNEPEVYDQGDIGSCVLNATCGAMNIVLGVERQTTALLARLFLYWLCRKEMRTLTEDSGTYTHLAVERVGNIGVCSEALWGYSDGNLYNTPDEKAFAAASDNKATAWFRVDATGADRLDQLEAIIRSNHPFIFGTPCSRAIQRYLAGDVLSLPDLSDIIGGHSMCGTGVRRVSGERTWRIRNSWSKSYGDNGHLLIDDNWMGWDQLDDIWVLTRMDALLL